eukprot:COSAG04_NODE_14484_length_566_cov_0.762313_1_plen_144_part_10
MKSPELYICDGFFKPIAQRLARPDPVVRCGVRRQIPVTMKNGRLHRPHTAPTGYVTCTHLPPPALAVLLPFAAGTASSSRGWLLGRFADCGDASLSLEELPLPALFFALFVFFLLELLPSGSSRSALAPPPPPPLLLDLDLLVV